MKKRWVHLLLFIVLLSACSQQQESPKYDEIKKMLTDSLQTEDGKKAIRQILSDPEFRELLVLEQAEVKKSIQDTLLSKQGEDFWKHAFEDPKFSESIAKSMKEQQQEIMKLLINDSSFQKDLESFFGQPDMQKQLEKILSSANMKKEMEKVVEDTIKSPLLQTKWQQLILQAGESKTSDSSKGSDGQSGGGEKQGGGGDSKKSGGSSP